MASLDDFLAEEGERESRCNTCVSASQEALDDIVEFMRRKREGLTHLPATSANGRPSLFKHLKTNRGYHWTHQALARHITHCLGLNLATGRPHGSKDE